MTDKTAMGAALDTYLEEQGFTPEFESEPKPEIRVGRSIQVKPQEHKILRSSKSFTIEKMIKAQKDIELLVHLVDEVPADELQQPYRHRETKEPITKKTELLARIGDIVASIDRALDLFENPKK